MKNITNTMIERKMARAIIKESGYVYNYDLAAKKCADVARNTIKLFIVWRNENWTQAANGRFVNKNKWQVVNTEIKLFDLYLETMQPKGRKRP